MKHIIIGTAGHIDHGKSALVKALTGTDPDRWAEEKRRGITIDLGFAHLDLGGYRFGFVDVPGHERFVRNMLAGAGGIDLVLLVIAADESIKPQTREHFDICRLLGVERGLVALTKADLVDPDVLDLVRLEAEEFLQGSFLEGVPIVQVSSKTGQGLESLQEALQQVAAEVPGKQADACFRLPVDRAFVMKGFGTVVTGTMISGSVAVEDEVEIFPERRRVRVRGIQVHGRPAERALAGQRTALNLAGVEVGELRRGMVLTEPGRFAPVTRLDTELRSLPGTRPLKDGARVHFHQGTAEMVATVRLFDRHQVEAGSSCFAQLRLAGPVLTLPGDRFILRQYSPVITIGGGRVLGVARGRYRRNDAAVLGYWKALAEGNREQVLGALIGREPSGVLTGPFVVARTGWREAEVAQAAERLVASGLARRVGGDPLTLVSAQRFSALGERAVKAVQTFHKKEPLVEGLPKEELKKRVFARVPAAVFDAELDHLAREGKLAVTGDRVKRAGREVTLSSEETEARQVIEAAFAGAGLQVPAVKEVLARVKFEAEHARKIVQILLREKVLVRVTEDLLFHQSALNKLEDLLRDYKSKHGDRINVGKFKDLAGVTRKYAIPLLEYLDRRRLTQRVGNERIIRL